MGGVLAVAGVTQIVKRIARLRGDRQDEEWQGAIEDYRKARERNAPEIEVEQAKHHLIEVLQERQGNRT